MDQIIVISLAAFIASMLTFFSGFGLGTILSPVFALFFSLPEAIAMTGVVHFLNNVFKTLLTYQSVQWNMVLKFGLPSIVGAFLGAYLLLYLDHLPVIYNYNFYGIDAKITLIKLIIGFLILIFSGLEIINSRKKIVFSEKFLTFGGFLSGFFGGLSGNQGALRSMFLVKSGLEKSAYVATGIIIACLVDITRLGVYWNRFQNMEWESKQLLIFFAVLSAFLGAYLGNKLLKKITLDLIQKIVTIFLILIAIFMIIGLV